jgi:hypothetical protein
MDCGAWKLDEHYYVLRWNGSEHRVSTGELAELCYHLCKVRDGESESLSTEYLNLPAPAPTGRSLSGLLAQLGLVKPTHRRPA